MDYTHLTKIPVFRYSMIVIIIITLLALEICGNKRIQLEQPVEQQMTQQLNRGISIGRNAMLQYLGQTGQPATVELIDLLTLEDSLKSVIK